VVLSDKQLLHQLVPSAYSFRFDEAAMLPAPVGVIAATVLARENEIPMPGAGLMQRKSAVGGVDEKTRELSARLSDLQFRRHDKIDEFILLRKIKSAPALTHHG
jgi:hypothetical protein